MNPLDDTLNVGATLPRQGSETGSTSKKAEIDDLESLQTIRMPGSGTLVFNRYRLQRVLGRGGMGVVWLAVDTKLERAVALKFLPDIVGADPVALKELKDETRRGLDLAHPNIVRIYDFVDDDDAAAISMEFVDGKSLSEQRLAKPSKVFSTEEIAPWVAQMCDALDYAHLQRRIVHRDLKPANLMVNSESEIKITDFGIARSVTDTMSRLSRSHNATSGTLLYMSPQQAMGERPRPTDDVYALGATIYELLTGKPPFYSGDISMQITAKIAPSLKARREELEINAPDEIPKAWEDAIAACLDKDQAKRPQTAGEFARMLGLSLRRETQAETVKTKAGGLKQLEVGSRTDAQAHPKKRSKVLAIVLGALALLAFFAVAGTGALWWWFHREGSWVVQTDPPGVQVTLDGRTLVAPATVTGLKPGTYKADLAMAGYEPRQLEFEVEPGQKKDLGPLTLDRSTGSLLISSDPDGVAYEVKSATDEKAEVFKGETPNTIKLPIGKYSLTMKHDGEIKTKDIEIARNDNARQAFAFTKPPSPPAPAPVIADTPPPAAPAVAAADTPPPPAPAPSPGSTPASSVVAPPAAAPTPPAPGSPAGATPPSSGQASASPPASPAPSAAPADASGPAATAASQPVVEPPAAGYWKLDEILAHSEYSRYSDKGRGYVVYKAQLAMKQSADGVPGKGTYKAIQKFQSENGLQPTGQLDSPTLAAMELKDLPDKADWGKSSGSRSSGSRTPESEKTQFRKMFERNVLGGRDLKDIFRR